MLKSDKVHGIVLTRSFRVYKGFYYTVESKVFFFGGGSNGKVSEIEFSKVV